MEPMELALLGITAAATSAAAIIGLLAYRARHQPHPINITTTTGSALTNGDTRISVRQIDFTQQSERPEWEINELSIANTRCKWLYNKRQDRRNFAAYDTYKGAKWVNSIKYRIPIKSGGFILHPDAPSELLLLFRVVLKTNNRVTRKIRILCRTSM